MSESDKAARREAILTAAEAQLREAGFEAFSMEVLARTLGVARGTLYRYFATRETVLLELYLAQRSRFAAAMTADVGPGIDDAAFVTCWYDHATSDPLFLMLQARLGSVIEHNIPRDALITAKRAMQTEMEDFAGYLAACLNVDPEHARRLIVGLVALLLGAAELDTSPRLNGLPEEFAASMALFASRRVFTDNARLILDGLRREARQQRA
ncbi:MAG: TetR/AcrR family transcriptional regulator [Pseudomonadales bacterium]